MDAYAVSLLALFESKLHLEVPLFQRQYIWNEEKHWEPLWEGLSRKFSDSLDGRKETPVHFLGAMVLDQKQTPATQLGKRQVIDGQQRLTTFQIFMAACRDSCARHGCQELAEECRKFTLNEGRMTLYDGFVLATGHLKPVLACSDGVQWWRQHVAPRNSQRPSRQ